MKYLPPPDNDAEFEDLCLDLWREIWNDSNAQKYGRRGQKQKGIDISGKPNGGAERHTVQCKVRKDKLSTEDIEADSEAAKNISPKIHDLTFATTAPRDVNTQDFVDELSIKFQNDGFFQIHIWSWNDILEEIFKHPYIIFKHFPDQVNAVLYGVEIYSAQEGSSHFPGHHKPIIANVLEQGLRQIRTVQLEEVSEDPSTNPDQSPQVLVLDEIKDALNADKVSLAFENLDRFKTGYFEQANQNEIFRYYYYLGDAYNEVNEQEKCAQYFNEAYNTNPEHKIANKLKALALLIQDDKLQAGEYAQKAIEIDPCDEVAYQVMVQVYPERSVEQIIAPIPEDKKSETGVAFAISEVYRRKGKLLHSLEWLEKALASSNDSFKVKIHLAQALFEYAFKQCHLSYYGRKNPDAEAKIRRALELLDSAYEYIRSDGKLYQSRAYLLVNKANAYRLLGEYELSEKTFEEYFQIVDGDDEAIRLRALLAIETENFPVAEKLLKSIADKGIYAEVRLMLAEALKFQKKYDEALAILDEMVSESSEEVGQETDRLRVYILLAKGEFGEALKCVDKLLLEHNTIPYLLDKARVLDTNGQTQEAISVVKEAEKLVNESTSIKDKFDLGILCYELKRYNKAAYFLSQIDTTYSDSFLTQRLIYSYYFSGQERKAIEICQELREQQGIVLFAADMEGQLYQYIGDYRRAIKVYDQMLEVEPNKFEIKLRRALIWFLQDDFPQVDRFLSEERLTIDKSVNFEVGLNYTYLLKERGEIERALNTLYELRRVHFNRHEAHLKYIGLFFEHDESIAKIEGYTNVETVSINTAVQLQSKDGKSEWFIIEHRPDADIRFKELHIEHVLAKELLGKKVGQPVSNERVVKSIINKFAYTYQESMNRYNEYFPESNAMEKVQLPEIKEETSSLDSLRPLFDRVDAHNQFREKAQSFYEKGQATVGSLAALLGTNPIKVWAGLLGNSNIQLAATTGTEQERKAARGYLKAENITLVLDIVALLTIHELGIADKIKSVYKNLIVSWSTIQTVSEYLLELRGSIKKGYMTIGKEGDSYVKCEVKPEHLQKQYDFLNSLYLWIKRNCDIQPVNELLDINRFDREKLRTVLGESFFDSTLLATRENHLLYTDDVRLRLLGENQYQIKGVWTQALVMDLQSKELISNDKYADYVLRLVELGYDYISLNWIHLLESYRRSDWKCEGLFEKVIDIILPSKTTLDSSLLVLTDFYRELWRENIPLEMKEQALRYTLNRVRQSSSGVNRSNLEALFKSIFRKNPISLPTTFEVLDITLQVIRRLISMKFSKIEFTKVQVLNLFDDWQSQIQT